MQPRLMIALAVAIGGALPSYMAAQPRPDTKAPANAKPAAAERLRARLMRCGPTHRAICLEATVVMADGFNIIFDQSAFPTALGRVAQHRTVVLPESAVGARYRIDWQPPLFAAPFAQGAIQDDDLPIELRDALAVGDDPPAMSALIALLLVVTNVLALFGIPRLWWREQYETDDDAARELLAARALLSTQELEQWRGRAPKEGAPRRPDDATAYVAKSSVQP